MIYAIRAAGTPYIKFGRASSVARRIREMETGCPHDLEVLASADWPDGIEKGIHAYLDDSWQRGEWYMDSDRTAQVIAWLKAPDGYEACKRAGIAERLNKRASWSSPVELDTVLQRRKERQDWWAAHG